MTSSGRGNGSRGGTYAPEETRRILLDAALKLFEERGYHPTSVESIVAEAGVTKGAFYHHFVGKEDILHQIQEDYIDNRLRNCERIVAASDDPVEQLRELILEALVGISEYRPQVTIFLQERRFLVGERFAAIKEKRDAVDEYWVKVIRNGMESGVFAPVASPRIASFAILGMCGWAVTWYRDDGDLSLGEVAQQMTDLVIKGALPR
ncbi:AcrR family transcriptional regulator [Arthrobacter ginsengisoli]|uniref:AcrR family transcriptional regulator n=1 Tax=Arthrobacter ginsengisoli TaxID=1356565 RepID=A0ABU1UI29_9MICC|nr:TetR/AcrR family transcriptional regulator [Arthrobacter ginsengisoli]MDR7084834.1 AcrR family transcriptional regulator [Arthrobacter ginsengisoli]